MNAKANTKKKPAAKKAAGKKTAAKKSTGKKVDYKVADITLAAYGRREIAIAETEVPQKAAIKGRKNPRLYSHDHPDCRVDRNAD